MAVQHRFVSVHPPCRSPARLHVAVAGEGQPLVLLHGFPQHWRAWRKVLPMLSGEYRLICLDLRGFGRSETTRSGYDNAGLAADLVAALDALGLERVGLIGHDLGAQVAFRAALAAPDRISHLLALNTAHPWPLRRRMFLHAWRFWYTALLEYPLIGRLVLRHWPAFTRHLLRSGVGSAHVWDAADLDEFSAAASRSARAGQQVFWQYVLRDIPVLVFARGGGRRLTVPTILLSGSDDRFLPAGLLAGGERYADMFEVRTIPGAGHYLHEERPELVAAAARELFTTPARSLAGNLGP